jgi:hypothetical protein
MTTTGGRRDERPPTRHRTGNAVEAARRPAALTDPAIQAAAITIDKATE